MVLETDSVMVRVALSSASDVSLFQFLVSTSSSILSLPLENFVAVFLYLGGAKQSAEEALPGQHHAVD